LIYFWRPGLLQGKKIPRTFYDGGSVTLTIYRPLGLEDLIGALLGALTGALRCTSTRGVLWKVRRGVWTGLATGLLTSCLCTRLLLFTLRGSDRSEIRVFVFTLTGLSLEFTRKTLLPVVAGRAVSPERSPLTPKVLLGALTPVGRPETDDPLTAAALELGDTRGP